MSELIGKKYKTITGSIELEVLDFSEDSKEYRLKFINPDNNREITRSARYIEANFTEITEGSKPTDTGTDLIGKSVIRGNSFGISKLVSKHTCKGTPAVKIKCKGFEDHLVSVQSIRANLRDGVWKFVEEYETSCKDSTEEKSMIGSIFRTSCGMFWKVEKYESSDRSYLLADARDNTHTKILRSIEHILKNFTEVDVGADLVGRKVTRGGKCVYTFAGYNFETGNMKIAWSSGSDNFYTPEYCRKKLRDTWKFVDEYEDSHSIPETVKVILDSRRISADKMTQRAYNHFSSNGMNHHDLMNISDSVVGEYLEEIGNTKFKPHQIRQKIQNLIINKSSKGGSREEEQQKVVDGTKLHTEFDTNIDMKTIHGSEILIQDLEKSAQWQFYNALTGNYSTQPEEENIMSDKTSISIEVSTAAFATVESFDTVYGRPVSTLNEKHLFDALKMVDSDIAALKDLNTGTASSRITAKMKSLEDARASIIKAIDALPEDEA